MRVIGKRCQWKFFSFQLQSHLSRGSGIELSQLSIRKNAACLLEDWVCLEVEGRRTNWTTQKERPRKTGKFSGKLPENSKQAADRGWTWSRLRDPGIGFGIRGKIKRSCQKVMRKGGESQENERSSGWMRGYRGGSRRAVCLKTIGGG